MNDPDSYNNISLLTVFTIGLAMSFADFILVICLSTLMSVSWIILHESEYHGLFDSVYDDPACDNDDIRRKLNALTNGEYCKPNNGNIIQHKEDS
ncbi:MAG: hypothetical protein DRQ56_10835 [Gammaproteobacteria bacterium]|nr:MAG: hypothetical protein DRQ56_10835 [Gammaproteobacteria bacterium]